ncbi:MAG: glycoside hydrolase family 3 C-terminal domain-containing protein [Terracidiphilus sp.]|nr:glycoside hydrolase family 3 C-terminal domain-containing protein [Terracidiphilus sp.]
MKKHRLHPLEFLLAFVLAVLSTLAPALFAAQAPVPDSPAIEAKAHELLSKLTLEEKIKLIGGVDSMFTNAAPSINLPRFKMSDASVGIRTWGPTTAYAGGVALAATWDTQFARELGASIGKDARARSVHFLLGPGVNIARASVGGRNFEYLSEDPYLNATIVVPYIEGVQAQGVIATVKHYALNNQEFNRHNASADVDERTMRELYLPAFEAAIVKGHVDSVMNSYNLINGVHATQNEFLNLKVLKGEWGFKGILMSDWDATYDGVGAANYGLDLEMPNPKFMNAATLIPAVKSGQVKESVIDDKVLRLLRTELRYGFTDRPQFLPVSTYSVAARAVALKGALESITLLKNDGKLLPLDPAKTKTIAVIGPDAWPAIAGGGGSSTATPFQASSQLTGIADLLGPDAHVLYARGLPEMADVFRKTSWSGPVKMETFPNREFTGTPATTTRRDISDFKPNEWTPEDPNQRSIRYTASYTAKEAGSYLLLAGASGADPFKILVDGKQVVEQQHAEGQVPRFTSITLAAGQTIKLQADYIPHAASLRFGFGIVYEPALISDEAKQFAKLADAVVVAVGFDTHTEGEGHDRTFALPWGQDALIRVVADLNPHAIVTLTAGGAVDTRGWLDKVPAFLHLYYPGQEGGAALAQILFGQHAPEGKLPVSFESSWDQSPAAAWYYGKPGTETKLHVEEYGKKPVDLTTEHTPYGDKLMVGYRYWTTTGKHPLYPFGFGLSYTTFSFANLKVDAKAKAGSTVDVAFDVTNSGSVAGAEVAQLYVSDPSAKADRPERELKGFAKVNLAPGETKHVTLSLDARAFSYWSEAKKGWTIDPGKFVVRVGDSSEDTPLSAGLTLE